jgi:hypothetical protein
MVQEQVGTCALCLAPGSDGGLLVDRDNLKKRIRGLVQPARSDDDATNFLKTDDGSREYAAVGLHAIHDPDLVSHFEIRKTLRGFEEAKPVNALSERRCFHTTVHTPLFCNGRAQLNLG